MLIFSSCVFIEIIYFTRIQVESVGPWLYGTISFAQFYFFCPNFVVIQSLSHVQLFVTPQTVEHKASLSFTISWSLLKLMSIELVMPSNHLILCHPLLLPSAFPSIRSFLMSRLFASGGQVLKLQLQHQSFTDLGLFQFCLVRGSIILRHLFGNPY